MAWSIGKLAMYILAILMGLFILAAFLGKGSFFEEVKLMTEDAVSTVDGYVDIKVGLDERPSSEVQIPFDQQRAVIQFLKSVSEMEGKRNCFMNYRLPETVGKDGFPYFTEDGTKVVLKKEGSTMTIRVHDKGERESFDPELQVTSTTLEPCVISGTAEGESEGKDVASAFLEGLRSKRFSGDYFLPVSSIVIQGSDDEEDGNILNYKYSDGVSDDIALHDAGWLFTPDGKHICLFPTSGDREEGLDEDIFRDSDGLMVLKAKQGELPICSEQGEFPLFYSIEMRDTDYSGKQKESLSPKEVSQMCKGLVGKDCSSVIASPETVRRYRCDGEGKYPTTLPEAGCLIMYFHFDIITKKALLDDSEVQEEVARCDSALANEGDIINPTEPYLLGGRKWLAPQDTALVCRGNQWVGCTAEMEGASLEFVGDTYYCGREGEALVWQRVE